MIAGEIVLVTGIVMGVFAAFATEKYPIDFVSFSVITLLVLTGLLSPVEAVSGFSNQATITILGMFMLSEGIRRTGVIYVLGEKLLSVASGLMRQLLAISGVSLLGAFINNTASVNMLAPMIMDISSKTKTFVTQLLIPVSFLSMAAGTLTLIGTSTNLLVNDIYVSQGFEPIGIFEITKMGVFVFLAVVIYFFTIGRFLLPKHYGNADVTDPYQRMGYSSNVIVPEKSPLIGQTVKECDLKKHEIRVVILKRGDRTYRKNIGRLTIMEGDVLGIYGSRFSLFQAQEKKLIQLKALIHQKGKGHDYVLDQFMIASGSSLIDQKIRSIVFTRRFDADLLGIKRGMRPIKEELSSVKFRFADILLFKGTPETIERMKMSDDFVYIGEAKPPYRLDKMKYALGIMISVILLAAFKILPIMTATLLGVILMVLFKVISLKEGYKSVNWEVIFLLAGVIPLGIALQKTGAINLIADFIVYISSFISPVILLGIFYLIVTLLTEIISNNAAAIILAPVAIQVATELGLNPFAFIVVLMFAASTSFMTPVGYQTNTLVYYMGNYKFKDFTRVGLPLNIILMIITVTLTVWIWGL